MKKTKRTKKTAGTGTAALKIGAGLAAASAAAAGYYFYGSKGAKKHRKIAAKWAADMQKEVMKEAKRLEKANPKAVAAIVDRVAKTYQGVRSADIGEVKRATKELKANWEMVKKEAGHVVRKGASRAKKTVKKAVKRAK